MKTPICDFVEKYAASDASRLHMPGHKGQTFLGCEWADITEIGGADSLYQAEGIIRESECHAAGLFGTADTLYSTEGSSQCICAMLYLACLNHRLKGYTTRPVVVAGRNAHKAFIRAAALLDLDVRWLWPEDEVYTVCGCTVTPAQLEKTLAGEEHPAAMYITSPDYLGHTADVPALAEVAHAHGALMLVDNAHGAYLHFLQPARHPMDQGADLCCDSAHKTLPVLTGGAYLHISSTAPAELAPYARQAMEMFGSTSPSYLILQSLDRANAYLAGDYGTRLGDCVAHLEGLRRRLREHGWLLVEGDDVLKLTVDTRHRGYTGTEVADVLARAGVICEYADPDYVVLMFTPENTPEDAERVQRALSSLPEGKGRVLPDRPASHRPEAVTSIRQALMTPGRPCPTSVAAGEGRVLASLCVSCPPAVSCVVAGERIGEEEGRILAYYGIKTVTVLP